MNTARRQPVYDVNPPSLRSGLGERLERLTQESGLGWRELAASATVTERELMLRRGEGRGRTGPVHRAIVALAPNLPGGCHLVGEDDDGNHDHDGGEG